MFFWGSSSVVSPYQHMLWVYKYSRTHPSSSCTLDFTDFSNGVCHVTKITTAYSKPHIKLFVSQKAFCFSHSNLDGDGNQKCQQWQCGLPLIRCPLNTYSGTRHSRTATGMNILVSAVRIIAWLSSGLVSRVSWRKWGGHFLTWPLNSCNWRCVFWGFFLGGIGGRQ